MRVEQRWLLAYFGVATGMALLLSLYYLIKHKAFAFVDIGSDSFFQFLPLQVAIRKQWLSLHELTWSFELGLGGYLGSDFDPIRAVLALVFPDSWQLGIRLPVFWIQLIFAGSFFLGYLRKIGFAFGLAMFGALAYAFSSYSMINGQWDPYPLEILQTAAYLYFLETYFRGGSRWNAVAAGLTVGLGQVMDIYTFSLLTTLYLPARMLGVVGSTPKNYLLTVCRYGCWAALGFFLTAPIQFPNLHYFFENPRISGDHSVLRALLGQLWQFNDRAIIGSEIAGLFGKDLLGTGSSFGGWANYFEAPGFYVGLLLVLCIPQLLAPAATRREKRLCIGAMLLLAAYIIWPAVRLSVNGFGHSAFRLSTLWVSIGLLVVGLAGFRRALDSGPWRAGLLIAAAAGLSALTIVACALPEKVSVSHLVKTVAFIATYTAILWSLDARGVRIAAPRLLLPLFACELMLFAVPAMIERVPVNSDGTSQYGTYEDGTRQALAFVRSHDDDASFYRIEKTYNSVFLCDALMQNYHGIKSYYFHGSSLTRFVDSMHLPRWVQAASYISAPVERHSVLDLLGVKYMLSRGRSLDGVAGYTYVGSAGDIDIYRNEDSRGFVQISDSIASEKQAAALRQDQRDDLLLHTVVLTDADAARAELDRLNHQEPAGNVVTAFAALHLDSETRLSGEAHSPGAAVLLITMPYDSGWHATVDNARANLFAADYGLSALMIPPGVHRIELAYAPPGRALGIWIALAALATLAGSAMSRRKVVTNLAQ